MKNRRIAKVRKDTVRLAQPTGIFIDIEPKDRDDILPYYFSFLTLYNLGVLTLDVDALEKYIKKEVVVDDEDEF